MPELPRLPQPLLLSRRTMLRGMLVAGGAAVLTACAADEGAGSSPTGEAASGVDGEVERLTVALPGSLSSLDANTEGGILNYYVAAIAQEGLLAVGGDGSLQPALAESWEQPDNRTYVFTIRQDARFADGTDLTVDDILFSIEKARDPIASPSTGSYWPEIESVEQTGDWEITITLPSPNVSFVWILTNAGALWVTSRAFFEEAGVVGTAESLILGTGPYRAVEFQPDSHAVFERVDTWWGGVPAVQSVRFDFIADQNTRLLAQQSGDIDIALNVALDQVEAWEAIEGAEVLFVADHSYVGLQFNQNVAPFDDERVRRVFALATDREGIVASILRGHGEVAVAHPTPEQLAGALGEDRARELLDTVPTIDFDLEAAAAELAASSTPDGFAVELAYPNTGPQLGRAALALAANLAPLGIDLTVTEVPIEEWFTTLGDESRGVHFTWYFSTTGDPAEVISWYLRDENPYGFVDEDFSALLTRINEETDVAARAEAVVSAAAIAAEQTAIWPLWWGQAATAVGPQVSIADYTPFFLLGVWPNQITAA